VGSIAIGKQKTGPFLQRSTIDAILALLSSKQRFRLSPGSVAIISNKSSKTGASPRYTPPKPPYPPLHFAGCALPSLPLVAGQASISTNAAVFRRAV
jgi:hypothetical protein